MTDSAGKASRSSRGLQMAPLALLALICAPAAAQTAEETERPKEAIPSLELPEPVKEINRAQGVPLNATAATNPQLSNALFVKCAGRGGDTTKLEPDEQPGYVYGLSSEIFEKYDRNCNGALDEKPEKPDEPSEKEKYFADQIDEYKKTLKQDLRELEYQLKDKTQRSVAASNDRGTLNEDGAVRIAPAVLTDSVALSISGGASSPPGIEKKSGKIEMKVATIPIKSFRTAYPTTLAVDWTISAGREAARTATERTRTDDITITPLSYTLMSPDKNWAFKLGIGGSYVWTDTRTNATGATQKEDELTIAYVTSLEYKLGGSRCFKIKLDYELKQRHFFSEKVSSKVQPGVTYDFMCAGKEKRKAVPVQ